MARILVLGTGMIGSAICADLARRHQVTAADRNPSALASLADDTGVVTTRLDVTDRSAVHAAAKSVDLVVSAVPGFLGFQTLRSLIETGTNVADISFCSQDALELDGPARDRGVVVATDVGVAPGLDHLILGHHDTSMAVERFQCLVGGLPKQHDAPWQYKAPFSPVDVIEEYTRPARLMREGSETVLPALSEPEFVEFDGVGTLEAFNTDGLRSLLRTMGHIPDMCEKTLRYPGHRDLVLALRQSGFFSQKPVMLGSREVVPLELTTALLLEQWKLRPGEPEFTVMRVIVEGRERDRRMRHVWHLHQEHDSRSGLSSMASATGAMCVAVAEAILGGVWRRPGVSPGEIIGRDARAFEAIMGSLDQWHLKLRHESVALD